MPRRGTPWSIMLQTLTPVFLSADIRPIFSSMVNREIRSVNRASVESLALQNGRWAETLLGSQPQAWPLGRLVVVATVLRIRIDFMFWILI